MDYDVRAVGLASPPVSAPQQTYTPAIRVENVGIHPANVTGQITIMDADAGVQVFTSPLSLANLGAGESGDALAADTWTPPHAGNFFAFGFVTTDHDGNPSNGQLPPTAFICTGEPVPPPVVVPAHHQQHQAGGSDIVDVSGLPGQLADDQPPEPHASDHQLGGDDQLSVDGLNGRLTEDQPPDVHSNTKHNPAMATSQELTNHEDGVAVHTAATNLANRETTGPDVGLVPSSQLQNGADPGDPGDDADLMAFRADRKLGPSVPVHHATKHAPGGADPVAMPGVSTSIVQNVTCTPAGGQQSLAIIELTQEQMVAGTAGHFETVGTIATASGIGQRVMFTVYHQDGGVTTAIVTNTYNLAASTNYTFHLDAMFGLAFGRLAAGTMHGEVSTVGAPAGEIHADGGAAFGFQPPAAAGRFFLAVTWIGGAAGSTLTATNAIGIAVVRSA